MKKDDCVFCQKTDLIMENDLAKAFYDHAPMAKGHVLIVPKDHYVTFFDVPKAEQQAMIELMDEVKPFLDDKFHPRAYQIFSHIGAPAGQKVFHSHIHLVPVY